MPRCAVLRYTECRLASAAEDMLLDDLDADTVDFSPTFDASQVGSCSCMLSFRLCCSKTALRALPWFLRTVELFDVLACWGAAIRSSSHCHMSRRINVPILNERERRVEQVGVLRPGQRPTQCTVFFPALPCLLLADRTSQWCCLPRSQTCWSTAHR